MLPTLESMLVWGGVAGYMGGSVVAWGAIRTRHSREKIVMWLMFAGAAIFSIAIAERWSRVGYGPFLTMFEILLSNLASLGLLIAFIYWRVPQARISAVFVLPALLLMGVWIFWVPADASRLPATYETILLWIHVGLGKVFLATCLVAMGIAGVLLLKGLPLVKGVVREISSVGMLDSLIWRMMAVAFVFHSLMLIAGAVWAQDAWGRYWAWDPLETSAFLTWLALAISLHARVTWRLPPWAGWLSVIAVFVLAFLTFFGLPFSSLGPHRGIL